jgi:hypothetical protein
MSSHGARQGTESKNGLESVKNTPSTTSCPLEGWPPRRPTSTINAEHSFESHVILRKIFYGFLIENLGCPPVSDLNESIQSTYPLSSIAKRTDVFYQEKLLFSRLLMLIFRKIMLFFSSYNVH